MFVYFGDEVAEALKSISKSAQVLHLWQDTNTHSSIRRRENGSTSRRWKSGEEYASQVTTTKKITPHKLRSTYGTTLYQETGDIYLVADVLGHKDVNTTKKHYAAMDDARRRQAATAVRLRESMPEHEE